MVSCLVCSCGRPTHDDSARSPVETPQSVAPAAQTGPAAEIKTAPDLAASSITALSVIDQCSAFYSKQSAIRVESTLTLAIEGAEAGETELSRQSFAFERPNKFALRNKSGQPGMTLVSDGSKLSVAMPDEKQYSETAAPASMSALLEHPGISAAAHGPHGYFLLNLAADNPRDTILLGGEVQANYIGREDLGGQAAHRLTLGFEEGDMELWIAAAGDPLVLKASMKQGVVEPVGTDESRQTVRLVETFQNWQFYATVQPGDFVLQPSADFRKVDDLLTLTSPTPTRLLGKAAPDIELKLADGHSFSLKAHRGKEIVVLDFWATWCGPCIKELPVLAEVAAAYRHKGVVLRAVNLGDDAETIAQFVKQQQLDVAVVLDTREETAKAYQIDGIPFLAVVDKAGIIQAVHVGFVPDIKQRLERELDSLISGKSLVEPAKPMP